MRVKVAIDLEVDGSMPLVELDGLCAFIEQRRDVKSARLRHAVIVMPREREEPNDE